MNPILTLDHIVLVVGELPTAIRQFNQMGFTVCPGGTHAGGLTHNALVSFADGSYLELLATTRRFKQNLLILLGRTGLLPLFTTRDNAIHRRFKVGLAAGLGLSDYCLMSSDLDLALSAIQSRGLKLDGPLSGGRLRPDGHQINWRTAVPQLVDLPFLIEDLTPRAERVPVTPHDGHVNKTIGIAGITIGVRRLEESTAHYQALIGCAPEMISQFPLPGIQNNEFSLGATHISLIQPGSVMPGMRKSLGRRIACPLIVWLRTPSTEPSSLLGLSYLPGKGVTLSRGNPYT